MQPAIMPEQEIVEIVSDARMLKINILFVLILDRSIQVAYFVGGLQRCLILKVVLAWDVEFVTVNFGKFVNLGFV